MLSINAGEMARLVDEVRAAIEAAPKRGRVGLDGWTTDVHQGQLSEIRSWWCESLGWRLLVAVEINRGGGRQNGQPNGTAVRGNTIMHLPPELAQLAYKKARGEA